MRRIALISAASGICVFSGCAKVATAAVLVGGLLVFSIPADAALFKTTTMMGGDLTVISSNNANWITSDQDISGGRAALKPGQEIDLGSGGDIFLSGQVPTAYISTHNHDMGDHNSYQVDTALNATGGAVYGESLNMEKYADPKNPLLCDGTNLGSISALNLSQNPVEERTNTELTATGTKRLVYSSFNAIDQGSNENQDTLYSHQMGNGTIGFISSNTRASAEIGLYPNSSSLNIKTSDEQYTFTASNRTGMTYDNEIIYGSMADALSANISPSDNLTLVNNSSEVQP